MPRLVERETTAPQKAPPPVTHAYLPPYEKALCGHPRLVPIAQLTAAPKREVCVVCESLLGWRNDLPENPDA